VIFFCHLRLSLWEEHQYLKLTLIPGISRGLNLFSFKTIKSMLLLWQKEEATLEHNQFQFPCQIDLKS